MLWAVALSIVGYSNAESHVVLPARPGASFEVVEADGVFEFAVVRFDAPAKLG